MTGLRLELHDPRDYELVKDYIEKHLAPAATELHRITNELLSPGSTSSEEASADMMPSVSVTEYFGRLNRHVDDSAKHIIFDGSQYFSLPKELLRVKQVKVQLTAVLYLKNGKEADFRIVRDDAEVILDSTIHVTSRAALTYSCRLPFGDAPGCVSPDSRHYYIEAKALERSCVPVCRRFSMSFVYI